MKKVLGLVMLVGVISSSVMASMKYECNRYVGGDYKGFTYVVANSKSEAESKAYDKFKNQLAKRVDYVKCK